MNLGETQRYIYSFAGNHYQVILSDVLIAKFGKGHRNISPVINYAEKVYASIDNEQLWAECGLPLAEEVSDLTGDRWFVIPSIPGHNTLLYHIPKIADYVYTGMKTKDAIRTYCLSLHL